MCLYGVLVCHPYSPMCNKWPNTRRWRRVTSRGLVRPNWEYKSKSRHTTPGRTYPPMKSQCWRPASWAKIPSEQSTWGSWCRPDDYTCQLYTDDGQYSPIHPSWVVTWTRFLLPGSMPVGSVHHSGVVPCSVDRSLLVSFSLVPSPSPLEWHKAMAITSQKNLLRTYFTFLGIASIVW